MKKKILFLSLCAIFLLSSSVLANTTSKIGKKITAESPVYLNGELISDAIITEGSSFAPLRVISEKLGLDVNYETSKKGSVIKLTSPETKEISNESIWEKAEVQTKINAANREIERANQAIETSIKKLEIEKSPDFIDFYEKVIIEEKENIIVAQANIITYTNELLELESSN